MLLITLLYIRFWKRRHRSIPLCRKQARTSAIRWSMLVVPRMLAQSCRRIPAVKPMWGRPPAAHPENINIPGEDVFEYRRCTAAKESPRRAGALGTDKRELPRRPIPRHKSDKARIATEPTPPGITGRFVLLPKNVVTGAAKVDIMGRSTHTGRCFLWKATLQAPARSGLFVLRAPDPPLATTGRDLLAYGVQQNW
jgi:hypothetical protein